MNIKTIVLGSVLGVMSAIGSAVARDNENGEEWKRQQKHGHSSYQMDDYQHDYRPVAATKHVFYDYAKVISVTPVIRAVRVDNPHQYCSYDTGYQQAHRQSYTPLIVGGILGGVLGNQVGGGTGKDLLTIGGVILGASLGYDIGTRPNSHGYQPARQKHCEVVHDYHQEEHIDGYDVRYVYNGRTFIRRMDHPPGRKVRVRVQVTPEV